MASNRRSSGDLAIGICDRCSFKFPLNQLRRDGNSPGLLVCEKDWDVKDPWRLPPKRTERVNLRFPRPEAPLRLPDGTLVYES